MLSTFNKLLRSLAVVDFILLFVFFIDSGLPMLDVGLPGIQLGREEREERDVRRNVKVASQVTTELAMLVGVHSIDQSDRFYTRLESDQKSLSDQLGLYLARLVRLTELNTRASRLVSPPSAIRSRLQGELWLLSNLVVKFCTFAAHDDHQLDTSRRDDLC